ncbi:MAG: hypothetical protein ABSG81_08605 [Acidimicrobiales bacterium]
MDEPEAEHPATKARRGVPLWGIGYGIPAFVLLAIARRYGFIEPVPLTLVFGELMLLHLPDGQHHEP